MLVFTCLGILSGTVTGLTPGIHPNTLIFATLPLLVAQAPRIALPFIVSAAITHSMLNHIPAILLGVPDETSALTALPGKDMLLDGKGSKAIHMTLSGGLHTAATAILLFPLAYYGLPLLYPHIEPLIPLVVAGVVVWMIGTAGTPRTAIGITLLCGGVGIVTLRSSLPGSKALFPLFTGLFGIPVLLATRDGDVPRQEEGDLIPPSGIGKVIGALSGLLSGMLPGLGPSATVSLFDRFLNRQRFLFALGGINTADAIFSILALHTIGNPRSGASVAVEKLVQPGPDTLVLVISCAFLSIGTSYHLGRLVLPYLLQNYTDLDHRRLAVGVTGFLIVLVLLVSGPGGLAVLAIATGTGFICQHTHVRKSLCMSCLILPYLLQQAGITL